jgi:hypothetical protein
MLTPDRSSPYGIRTRVAGLRGRHPDPLEERAVLSLVSCQLSVVSAPGRSRTANARRRVGYGHLGPPVPSRRMMLSVARVGVEPTDHEGLSFAALPDCVPCRSRRWSMVQG